jgi:hypothetical protein
MPSISSILSSLDDQHQAELYIALVQYVYHDLVPGFMLESVAFGIALQDICYNHALTPKYSRNGFSGCFSSDLLCYVSFMKRMVCDRTTHSNVARDFPFIAG